MATKKLSEALAALQAAASVSGLTVRLVVAGKNETEKAQTITLAQLLTALGVPSLQTTTVGLANNYIYSNSNDKTKGALSGVFKVYQYDHELYLRHKYWGSSGNYDDGLYATVKIPPATTQADGVLEWEYLVRLRNATMTESGTTTAVNITYPNYANGGTKTLTLTAATTAKAGVMTVDQVNALAKATTDISTLNSRVMEVSALTTTAQKTANSAALAAKSAQSGVDAITPYVNTLQSWVVGELGNFADSDALDAALINMTKDTHKNGRYFAKVGDVPVFVTFEVLNLASNILCQWVEGAVTVASSGKISTNTTKGVRTLSRIYADGVWGDWFVSALKGDVPTVQTGPAGTANNYIYQDRSDGKKNVLCGIGCTLQENGRLKIRHKIWGSNNNGYGDGNYSTVEVLKVTEGADGAMNHDVYGRIINNTLSEAGSTTDTVRVSYTNFANGGANTLTISKATSAKAGVLTSAQYNQLTELAEYQRGLLGSFTTTDAFKTALAQMPTTHKGKCGRYYALVNGAIVFVSFALLEESSSTYSQWVEGPIIKGTDGEIYLNNELGAHLIGRIYTNGAWGLWRSTILDDELPLPASTTNDGLMSKEDKQLLEKIKTQLNL